MVNTFLIIFLNQKIGSILNPIRKKSLYRSCLQHFELKKKKKNIFNKRSKRNQN